MTTEEIQISNINKLKSVNKDLMNVRRKKTEWILRYNDSVLEYGIEDSLCKSQVERLSNEEKSYEELLSNLIELL